MTRLTGLFPVSVGFYGAGWIVVVPNMADQSIAYLAGFSAAMAAVYVAHELLGEGSV